MSVWRNSWVPNEAVDLDQFARIGAIFFGEVKLISSSKDDAAIREKIRVLSFDSTNSTRFSRRQRNLPETCWKVVAAFRYKQGRTVRCQSNDHWIGNCRWDGCDGTAGYRDLCNLEISSRALVEVNAQTVGYCLGEERLRLTVIRRLGYCFHKWNGRPADPPEDKSCSNCNGDYSGCNPCPWFRRNGRCINQIGRGTVSIKGVIYSVCPVRNRLGGRCRAHCRLVDDGGHEAVSPLRKCLNVPWILGVVVQRLPQFADCRVQPD